MAPQELDEVLSIESFAEVTKRNRDDNELDSLKIMPLNGMKEKKRTIHWASCTRGSFTTQKKSIAELSFSKDNKKSQPQPQKKERPSIIDSGDEN